MNYSDQDTACSGENITICGEETRNSEVETANSEADTTCSWETIARSEEEYDDTWPRVLGGDIQETEWQYLYQPRKAEGIKVSLSLTRSVSHGVVTLHSFCMA